MIVLRRLRQQKHVDQSNAMHETNGRIENVIVKKGVRKLPRNDAKIKNTDTARHCIRHA